MRSMVSERWLTRRPCTLVLNLVWASRRPSRENLWLVLSAIRPVLSADRVFRSQAPRAAARRGAPSAGSRATAQGTPPPPPATPRKGPAGAAAAAEEDYTFCGMICYYGMHYIAIFWCWSQMQWTLFDDTAVRQEKDWSSVVGLILSGCYVPTLLFHERGAGRWDWATGSRAASLVELERQIEELEDRAATNCVAM